MNQQLHHIGSSFHKAITGPKKILKKTCTGKEFGDDSFLVGTGPIWREGKNEHFSAHKIIVAVSD